MLRLVLLTWPFAAALAVVLGRGLDHTALRHWFFLFLLLWPATLTVASRWGTRPAAWTALGSLGLTIAAAFLPPPIPAVEPHSWEVRFMRPEERVRHQMLLPVDDRPWRAAWAEPMFMRAFIYVQLSLAPGVTDPGLALHLDDLPPVPLSAATRMGGEIPAGASHHVWHRVPAAREQLERAGPRTIEIGTDDVRTFRPGQVGVVGGFSFRPTAPPTPSARFDGYAWSTELDRALRPHTPSTLGRVLPGTPWRYYVEIRVVDERTNRLALTYY